MTASVRTFLLVSCAALIGVTGSAYPQTMYRCGKSFQDRPCDSAQPGQVMGRSAAPVVAPASGSNSPAVPGTGAGAAQCAERGIAAQKIKWEREAGMSEQAQLSLPKSNAQRQLIVDVYQRQGSAPQIRAAVEADCIKENERQAQAAALSIAAAKLLEQNPPLPAVPRVTAEASNRTVAEPMVAAQDVSRRDRCADLQRSADGVRERQRVGGGGARMDALNRERQEIDKRLGDAGC